MPKAKTKKQKSKNKHYINIKLVALSAIFVLLALLVVKRESFNKDSDPRNTKAQKISTTPAEAVERTDPKPKVNTIYLGNFNGTKAIFVTNERIQEIVYGNSYVKNKIKSPYYGEFRRLDHKMTADKPYDFKDLENPKIVYFNTLNDVYLGNFVLSKDKTKLYLTIFLKKPDDNNFLGGIENLFQIDLNTLKYKQLFSYPIESNEFEGVHGGISFEGLGIDYTRRAVASDKYLLFMLNSCGECDGGPAGVLVLNLEIGKHTYKKEVGNVSVNEANNSFSYQKLYERPNEYYKQPFGETFSEPLP